MLVKSETGGSGGLVRVRADSCAQLARRRGRGTRHWATVWAGQTAVEGGWGVGQRRGRGGVLSVWDTHIIFISIRRTQSSPNCILCFRVVKVVGDGGEELAWCL